MLLTLCTMMAFTMMLSQSPVAMGLWVLILALLFATSLATLTLSWFSFLLFLIYIGGMLVMFAYFVALQPNQRLKLLPMVFMSLIYFPIIKFTVLSLPGLPSHLLYKSNLSSISIIISSIQNAPFYLYLAIILFFTLVAVVKITNLRKGALRPFSTSN